LASNAAAEPDLRREAKQEQRLAARELSPEETNDRTRKSAHDSFAC
jgi:hypothetical protein